MPSLRILSLALSALVLAASSPGRAQDLGAASLDELLEIRVNSASKLQQTTQRAPASVTIITAEQIESYGYRTLGDALEGVAGLYLSYDRNYSYVGVRGFSRPTDYNNRVLVLVDGFRLNEDVYGYAPVGTDLPIDLGAVARIEIVRGPGSAGFGTAAMLAVVNVVLREPEPAGQRGEVAVRVGSEELRAASVRHSFALGTVGAVWSVAASDCAGGDHYFREYDLPGEGDGRSRGADWDRSAGATLRATSGGLRLTGLFTEREKGIPTGAYETDLGDHQSGTSDRYTLLGLDWSRTLGRAWTLRTRAVAGLYSYDGYYPAEGLLYGDSTDNRWWGAEVQATWEPRADRRLTAGVEYRDNRRADYRSFDESGTEYFDGDFPYRIASVYLEHELQLTEQLSLTLGARHDDYSQAGSSTNPRVALVYLPTRVDSLKLLFGRAFRAPNVYEVHYEAELDGAKGNPDLEPERIRSLEAIWQRRLGHSALASLSVFDFELQGLIEQVVDPADELLQFRNVGQATSRGAELGWSAHPAARRSAYASLTYQRTVDDATGARLTNSPAWLAKVGATSALGSAWMVSAEMRYETGRRTVQETTSSGFLVAHAGMVWTAPSLPLDFEARVRNLFDAEYALPGGLEHRQAAIEQDGRTWTARLRCRF